VSVSFGCWSFSDAQLIICGRSSIDGSDEEEEESSEENDGDQEDDDDDFKGKTITKPRVSSVVGTPVSTLKKNAGASARKAVKAAKTPTTKKSRRKTGKMAVEDEDNEDNEENNEGRPSEEGSLYDVVMNGAALETAISDWVDTLQSNREEALVEIINFIIEVR
jgi:hypothetical protein